MDTLAGSGICGFLVYRKESMKTRSGVTIEAVEVVEVNRENLTRIWPFLLLSIKRASLIAIDLVSFVVV